MEAQKDEIKVSGLTVARLGDGNEAAWLRDIRSLLIFSDLGKAIEPDATPSAKENAKALALINLCVSEHRKVELQGCTSALAAYQLVEALHQSQSVAMGVQLKRQLNSLMKKSQESMVAYVNGARDIQSRLSAAGINIPEGEVVLAVLAGLSTEYDGVVTALEGGVTELTFEDVMPKLLAAEQRVGHLKSPLGLGIEHAHVMIQKGMRNTANMPRVVMCWNCGKQGHVRRNCPEKVTHATIAL